MPQKGAGARPASSSTLTPFRGILFGVYNETRRPTATELLGLTEHRSLTHNIDPVSRILS